MKKVLFVFGTRPEVIKIAPVVLLMKQEADMQPILCNTGQQRELSQQALSFFGLKEDYNLDVMEPNQSLPSLQAKISQRLQDLMVKEKFDCTAVQGDTMSTFCGSIISYYNRIPIAHIEAGLRSHNLFHPFPEEGLRQCISRIANFNFAPTINSKNELLRENIDEDKIFITGNTVVDALRILTKIQDDSILKDTLIPLNKEIVLVTFHRRENHGDRLQTILETVQELAKKYKNYNFVIPVHPNPNVNKKTHEALSNIDNVILTKPLDYPILVQLIKKAKLILTDSGGIQEEAPSFGCPTIILRDVTERIEGVNAGFAKLLGAKKFEIIEEASKVLDKTFEETRLNVAKSPYGDGTSAKQIVEILKKKLQLN